MTRLKMVDLPGLLCEVDVAWGANMAIVEAAGAAREHFRKNDDPNGVMERMNELHASAIGRDEHDISEIRAVVPVVSLLYKGAGSYIVVYDIDRAVDEHWSSVEQTGAMKGLLSDYQEAMALLDSF